MNEVRAFGLLLAILLTSAYLSWTHEDDGVDTSEVTLFDIPATKLERIELFAKTQTVAVSLDHTDANVTGWFEIKRRSKRTVFTGNDEAGEMFAKFAPFTALRSLGKNLSDEELEKLGLDKTERSLVITANGQTRTFEIGARSHGARDHYIRAEGSPEVFLVASKTIADFEFPESRFMQRKILVRPLGDVDTAVLVANGKTLEATHKNRNDRTNAFWSGKGETKPNEQLGSFMLKLSRLTIRTYPEDLTDAEKASTFLEIDWRDERGESMGTTTLSRLGEGKTARYFAKSDTTRRPGELSKTAATQLEQDMQSVLQ
ncbi:MAG: DUF4340 domain-containing protein [Myxococcota bacterium]